MERYRSTCNGEEGEFRRRLLLLIGGTVICFLILLLRLWYLQIIQGEKFTHLAENNRVRIIPQRDIRGEILDRTRIPLATNRPSFHLFLRPEDVQNIDYTLTFLERYIGLKRKEVEEKLKASPPYRSISVARDLDRQEVAYIAEHNWDFPGLSLEVESLRHYRYGTVAAHILGYIGEISEDQWQERRHGGYQRGDFIGQYGIEKFLESMLRGKKGVKGVEVDALGRELRTLKRIPPRPGNNVLLTIDLALQQYIEENFTENAGVVVVLDPRNGAVLALFSKPAFDPNLFARGISRSEWNKLNLHPRHPLQNRAITGQYPPGSVYKIVMAAAGLEEKVVTPQTSVGCGGVFPFGNRVFHDWKPGGHGTVTIHEALVESCDVYFYRLGSKLPIDTIARYARGFGLGKKTGIDLSNEKEGLVPSSAWKKQVKKEPWYPGETISVSIGQGYNLVTPLQLASLISAVANGGTLWKPQVVQRIETPAGKLVKEFAPQVNGHLPVQPKTLQIIRAALYGVVNDPQGTAKRGRIEHFGVAGKTGTVQTIGVRKTKDLPELLRDHGWFVAFAPYEKPEIALAILGEHGGKGGSQYAPLAKQIIEKYFNLTPARVAQGEKIPE